MQPPRLPTPPSPWPFKARIEKVYAFQYTEPVFGYDEDVEDDDDRNSITNEVELKEATLQDLIDCIPPGMTADQIKIEFGYESSRYRTENHYFKLYHELDKPEDKAGYDQAMLEYEEAMQQYRLDKAAYDKELIDQEIRVAEQRLQNLRQKRGSQA